MQNKINKIAFNHLSLHACNNFNIIYNVISHKDEMVCVIKPNYYKVFNIVIKYLVK